MDTPIPAGSIVVGIDGSEAGKHAVLWATQQARLEHRQLVLVHGVNPQLLTPWVGEAGFDNQVVLDAMEREGRDLLDHAYAEIQRGEDNGLVVHREFRLTDPRQMLIDLSDEASMIVVGSRGRGPVRSLLLGSVSVAVSQHARCPVVVLRPQKSDTEGGRVVVGATVTRPVSAAVDFAYRQASLRGLPLTIVHGFWDPLLGYSGATPLGADDAAFEDEAAVLAVRGAELKEKFPDVEVTYRLSEGLPDDCLIAASRGSGMVVVGTQRKSIAMSLFEGQVSRSVTEHAHCAVAVVPES